MSGHDSNREEGVDFTDIDSVLADISYPVEKHDFVDEHGHRELERTNAEPISIEALFEGTGEDTFHSAEEVRKSMLNLMPQESVGRAQYSDRGGSAPHEAPNKDGHAKESF